MGLRCEPGVTGVDSCIILRFLLRDVPEQAEMIQDLLMNGQDYYVDDLTVIEVVHVLTIHGKSREVIVENVLGLLDNMMFVWKKDFFAEVFDQYLKHPALSFDDIVLAQRVGDVGCEHLWTLDLHFAEQSKMAKLLD